MISVPNSSEQQTEYANLFEGEWGPTHEVLQLAESPLSRAKRVRDNQVKSKRRGTRTLDVESLKEIRQRLRSMSPFQPHEYALVFGLLIARMLCPHKRRLSSHWSNSATSTLPAGTFSGWMPRNRYRKDVQVSYPQCLTTPSFL